MTSESPEKRRNRRPTMLDIAKAAGVDISTVSRALANSPLVADDTRERIAKIVEQTGYVINHGARTLRAQRAGQILVMLPSIASPFFPELVLGIEEVAQEHGFNVVIGNTQYDPERESALAKQLLTGAVDGLVLLTGSLPTLVTELDNYDRRVVTVSRRVSDRSIRGISIDNDAAARIATQHLIECGHRLIAHIAGPQESPVFRTRAKSYNTTMREAGLAAETRVVENLTYDIQGGYCAMHKLLEDQSPTAVLAASDEMAIGAMKACRERGLNTPDDVAFVGFDDIAISAAYDPPLTTIHIPRREMGRVGATMLFQTLGNNRQKPKNVVLDGTLIVRKSTVPAG